MPHIALFVLMFLTAVPLVYDLSRPWLVPFLVVYAVVAAALAVSVETEAVEARRRKRLLESEKKTDDTPMFMGVRLEK